MKKTVTIPLGYTLQTKEETLPLYDAFMRLSTRAVRRYSSALRDGQNAVLTRHTIRCPHCSHETPAYDYHLFHNHVAAVIPSSALSEWAQIQLTFFSDAPAYLSIQSPVGANETFHCPHCRNYSEYSEQSLDITVEGTDSTVSIERCVPTGETAFRGERLVFDLINTAVYMELFDESGLLQRTDNLLQDNALPTDLLKRLLDNNRIVKRSVRRAFAAFWKTEFPFSTDDITFSLCMTMTRYYGFDKTFYKEIPYEEDSDDIDRSFLQERCFHNPASALALFANSSLPQTKSIRKSFVCRPSLFFYLKECEILYTLLADINLFRKIITHRSVFDVLLLLKVWPGIIEYMNDYKRIRSANALCNRLLFELNPDSIIAMTQYAALSEYGKQRSQQSWKHKENTTAKISTPLSSYQRSIPDTTIRHFSFRQLTTLKECKQTGKRMNNCLVSWRSDDNPVVVIYKRKKYPLAAVEIKNGRVLQAYRPNNQPIEPNSALQKALIAWCKQNRLHYNEKDCL